MVVPEDSRRFCAMVVPEDSRRFSRKFQHYFSARTDSSTHYLQSAAQLDAQKILWPRTIVATKTKRPLWSCVIVAAVMVVFSYQNAAVSYLNVGVVIFANFLPTKQS